MFCIVGWCIFWMTMLQCETKTREPKEVFTEMELRILSLVVRSKTRVNSERKISRITFGESRGWEAILTGQETPRRVLW